MSKFNVTNNVSSFDISTEINDAISRLDELIIKTAYQKSDPSNENELFTIVINEASLGPDLYGNTSGGLSNITSGTTVPPIFYYIGGNLTLNSDLLNFMISDIRDGDKSTLYYVILHEILHILGLQQNMWEQYNYFVQYTETSSGSLKYYYNGPNALREYKAQFNNENFIGIPVEDDGVAGTVNQHFEEGNGGLSSIDRYINVNVDGTNVEILHPGLTSEIITGFLDPSPEFIPLNLTTIGALQDIGFDVDYTKADNYYEPKKDIVCFLENTKISCLENNEEKEILVQDLLPGTLVKTCMNGYVPLDIIGNKTIVNPNCKIKDFLGNRLKNQLYVLKNDNNDPLVLTGCHSLLVDKLTDSQQMNMLLECNGKTYMTDDKYRLMAYLSDMEIYDYSGSANIWHFSLEREDSTMNYGVYANGTLVESCSKRMMLCYSDMNLKHYSNI